MKYIQITLFLFSSFVCVNTSAQIYDSAQIFQWAEKSYQFQDSGRYDSAIHYMGLAAKWPRTDTTVHDQSTANDLLMSFRYELSKLYIYQGDFLKGDQLLQYLINTFDEMGRKDSLYTELYHNLGMLKYNIGDYPSADEYLYQALEQKLEIYGEDHASTANSYNALGNLVSDQGDFNLARDYYLKALEIRRKVLPDDHMHIADTYQNLGILAYSEGDYDEAIRFMSKGFEIEKRTLPPNHPNLASSYNNLGVMFDLKGDYVHALEYYRYALDIRKEILGEEHSLVAQTYHNIGVVYQEKGDFREALDNYVKALYLYRQSQENPNTYEIASTLENIGSLYMLQNNYQEALAYHEEALEMNEKLFGYNNPEIADDLLNLSRTLIALGKLDQARVYLEKTKRINVQTRPNHPDRALVYTSLGEWYHMQGAEDSSFKAYEKAISILRESLDEKHPTLATVYNEWAEICELQGKVKESIALSHFAMKANLPDFNSDNEREIPSPKDIPFSIPEYLRSLHRKANLLSQGFSNKLPNYEENVKDAMLIWDVAIYWLDQAQTQYSYRQSKLDLRNKAREIYEAAIQARFEVYKLTNDEAHLERAFQIAEKAQSAILHEWIQDVQARTQAGIPSDLLERENELRTNISYYEKQVYELQNESVEDSAKLLSFRVRLFDIRAEYDSLLAAIEQQYPQYHEIKYSKMDIDIDDIQRQLSQREMMVRYFLTPNQLFTFSITNKELSVHAQSIDSSFYWRISNLYGTFQNFGWNDEQWDQHLDEYVNEAFALYKLLLAPVEKDNYSTLRIIPDGVLGFIPFEALLNESVDDPSGYGDLPFLLKKYEISYAYSAQLMFSEHYNPSSTLSKFMGFAPAYGQGNVEIASTRGDRELDSIRLSSLNWLTYNQPEVEELSRIMSGKAYLGDNASEKQFKSVSGQAGIIHLAMHTLLDDSNPLYSRLVFTQAYDTTEEDNLLHTYELFNMNLNADLVVLSACNSGVGEIQRGEGMLSLARAFRYAGCPNLVLTLWQTDDQAAYHVMKSYYQFLNKGATYPEALRNAKLDYLQHNDQVHPFYWANFVYLGKDQALKNSNNSAWLWVLLVVLILGVITWIRRKKLKR